MGLVEWDLSGICKWEPKCVSCFQVDCVKWFSYSGSQVGVQVGLLSAVSQVGLVKWDLSGPQVGISKWDSQVGFPSGSQVGLK